MPLSFHGSTAGRVLVSAVIVFCPLALGAVRWWSQAVFEGVVVAVLVWALVAGRVRRWRWPAVAWIGVAFAALTALQLVPLPEGLLKLVSPVAHDWSVYALRDIGLYPPGTLRPVSLAPVMTLADLARTLGYLGLFVLVFNELAAASDPWPLWVLAGTGGASVGIAAAMQTLNVPEGFGMLPGDGGLLPLRATFVNPNHQAAFLALAGFVGLGLAVSRQTPAGLRVYLALASVLALAGDALTLSRAGILLLPAGLIAFAAMKGRGGGKVHRATLGTGLAAVVLTGAVVMYAGWDRVTGELMTLQGAESEDPLRGSKLRAVGWALEMAGAFPWLGVGRGAYVTAVNRWTDSCCTTWRFVESEPAQLVVDFGGAAGPALVLAMAIALSLMFWRAGRGSLGAGIGAAVGVVVAHSLVDFAVEFPGVMAPLTVVLAYWARMAQHGVKEAAQQGAAPVGESSRRMLLAVAGVAVALAVTAGGALAAWRLQIFDARQALDGATPLGGDFASAEAAVQRILPYYVADAPMHERLAWFAARHVERDFMGRSAVEWVNRARYFRPANVYSLRLAAYALASQGFTDVAISQMRAAALKDVSDDAMRELLEWTYGLRKSPKDLLRVAGTTARGMAIGALILADHGQTMLAGRWLDYVLTQDPKAPHALVARMTWDLQAGEYAKVAALQDTVALALPDRVDAWRMVVHAQEKLGDHKAMRASAERAYQMTRDGVFLRFLARAAGALDDDAGLDRLMAQAGRDIELRSEILYQRGRRALAKGEFARGLRDLNLCLEYNPGYEDCCREQAEHFARVGRIREAVTLCKRFLMAQPKNAYCLGKVDEWSQAAAPSP